MELFLFDDAQARRWAPFSLTRPVGELVHGCMTQRGRWERVAGVPCSGHLVGEDLLDFEEPDGRPAFSVPPADSGADSARLFISSRAVPDRLAAISWGEAPATLVMAGETVGWLREGRSEVPSEAEILEPTAAPAGERVIEIEGHLLGWPWELVEGTPGRITADFAELHHAAGTFNLMDVPILGDHALSLGSHTVVEPGVIIDLRAGPIRLDDGVVVQGPARLVGPLYVASGSRIVGGTVGSSSIGPHCRIRGEVSASVFLGYANKAHDGYLGHSYVGRWVNLGALTTNSDLKNSYSSVRVSLRAGESIDTGLLKVGCLLGDHVKTGIGTLLNTGTVVGAGSNLFGGRMPPKYVPAFSWGEGDALESYQLDKFLEVAEAVMARREIELGPGLRKLLTRAWERTEEDRSERRP